MKPLNSLAMWESIKKSVETDSWESYFNKQGADGTLLDTDDTVSFINATNDKAIKLTYDPSKKDLIDY